MIIRPVVGACVRKTAAQTIPDATDATVDWDAEYYDDLSIWSIGQKQRLYVPAGVKFVRAYAGIRWVADPNGDRKVRIRWNGTGYDANSIFAAHEHEAGESGDCTLMTPILAVTAGDYFDVVVTQNSGGPLDLFTATASANRGNFFGMEIIK